MTNHSPILGLLWLGCFERQWWERAWVTQELVSARTATCYCGKSSIPWRQLAIMIELMGVWPHAPPGLPDEFSQSAGQRNSWSLMDTKYFFDADGYVSLCSLLHRNQYRNCLDPRDKVYSILGLTDRKTRVNFKADYTKSDSWVYSKAVKCDIESEEDLEMLTLVHHVEVINPEYPSWVADFQQPSRVWRFNKFLRDFESHGSRTYSPPIFADDLTIIHVDSFYIDSLELCNVQLSNEPLRLRKDLDSWSWDIEFITNRLIASGSVRGSVLPETQARALPKPIDVYRTTESALYDILIAGQVSTSSGWKRHEVTYPPHEHGPPLDWKDILHHATTQTQNRTVILSKGRYLRLAPLLSQPGDKIFILFGLQEPAILRPRPDGSYLFVGTAYVHGLMRGEVLKDLNNGYFNVERVTMR